MIADAEVRWYVQVGSRVRGPYSAHEIGRELVLGRVRATDRVSCNGELWEQVGAIPELIPEELLDFDACAYPIVNQPVPAKPDRWIVRKGQTVLLYAFFLAFGFLLGRLS